MGRIEFVQLPGPGCYFLPGAAEDESFGWIEQLIESGEQRCMSMRVLFETEPGCTQRPLGRLQVAWLGQQVSQSLEHQSGNAVSGRSRVICKGFGTINEGLVIVRSEVETAGSRVHKMVEHDPCELTCEFELCAVEPHLLKLEDRVDEEYVVVEVRAKMCDSVLVGRQ